MKKLLSFLLLLTILSSFSSFAQSSKYGWLTKDSWAVGFGFAYPKIISTNVAYKEQDWPGLGGFLSIQKNFSEHVGFRLGTGYTKYAGTSGAIKITTHNIPLNFDLLYHFVPCEPVTPYLGIGLGLAMYDIKTDPKPVPANTYEGWNFDYQFNILFGANWRIGENWSLKSELQYHTLSTSHFDGVGGTGTAGVLGAPYDAYMSAELGLLYYFGYGEKSHICELYEGLRPTDYDKIEDIVKKYAVQPTEVDYNRIEDIVKRNQTGGVAPVQEEANWVLIGTNFDFNKATIRPESYPILYNAAEILLKNPSIKVEIQGHTDNVGSDSYNQRLSLKRAEAVKNFLVAKGVAADRLTTVGMGESKPAIDNKTADTRALNRRIEFKIIK